SGSPASQPRMAIAVASASPSASFGAGIGISGKFYLLINQMALACLEGRIDESGLAAPYMSIERLQGGSGKRIVQCRNR
ncbi:hypothetical protein LXM94_25190, partial [Rhizobium sp. TRM95111]|uniref:hypothetical protein n=1 Tax=Rhizobium alarense TaxID=2846851 RepID=UPI001F3029F6